MWTIKISPAFFLASMLVFQSGCTNVKMIGSPDTDAMLIVGCDDISWAVASRIQWKLSSHNQDYPEPTDCWVAQVGESDNRSNNIKAISLDRSSGQSGLFVFPDLKPGTYHLSTIAANCQVRAPDPADPVDQGEYLTLFYEFPVSDFPELKIALVPGQIIFLGVIELGIKHRDSGDKIQNIRVNRSDKNTYFTLDVFDESSVLSRVLNADSDSPWVPELRSRLTQIEEPKELSN